MTQTKLPFNNTVILLLFLFPLAGNIVQHWTGIIFFCLLFVSMIARPWQRCELLEDEKRLLAISLFLFLVAILSNIINNWTETQTKGLGVLIRYLAFIPIYILIRSTNGAFRFLAFGSSLGAVLLASSVSLEVIGNESIRAYGIYKSPGLIAAQATVFALVLAHALRSAQKKTIEFWVYLLGAGAGIYSLILSGSRSGYLAALIVILLYIFFESRGRARASLLIAFLASLTLIFNYSETAKTQSVSAINEIRVYFSSENNLTHTEHSSVGQRIEMWRVSVQIVENNPLLGVGWRNFSNAATSYVEAGRANPQVIGSPHPHNTYLEFLVSFGFFGFSFLFLFFLILFKISFNTSDTRATLLRYLLVFYVINAFNEGGLFIYGNSLSFFLVFIATLATDLTRRNNGIKVAQRNNVGYANAPE